MIRLSKGQLRLYITVLSLALEFGDALPVHEGPHRDHAQDAGQQHMPSSMLESPSFHAQQLTLEFATLPDRLALTGDYTF